MFKVTKLVMFCFIAVTFFSLKSFAQESDMPMDMSMMVPPKPVENKVYEAMVGEWTGESEMMGMKWTEHMKVYWALNHQFLIMELSSSAKENPDYKYSAMGIFGVDKNGNSKSWWFDDWGIENIMSGSGTFDGMNLSCSSSNSMSKHNSVISWKDGNMVMKWDGSCTMDGKEMKMSGETVYKKK